MNSCEEGKRHFLLLPCTGKAAHGGALGMGARQVCKALTRASSDLIALSMGLLASELQQRTSITPVRENARAVRRRMQPSQQLETTVFSAARAGQLSDYGKDT